MVVLLEGSPISTEELWSSVRVTIGFLVTSLTKALLPLIAQFGRAASSRKSPGGSKLLPFKNDGLHSVLCNLQCCRNVFYPSPDLYLDTILSELCRQFLWPHGLGFCSDMHCQLWDVTVYRQVCAFPNHVQSIEFTTGGLQSCYRNISRMINGSRMHLSSILNGIAKGLNTYVHVIFNLFTFFYKCANISKNMVSLCYYGLLKWPSTLVLESRRVCWLLFSLL